MEVMENEKQSDKIINILVIRRSDNRDMCYNFRHFTFII